MQLLTMLILEEPSYGYMMVKKLEDMNFTMEENTLYPLLRRLESKSLVEGKWTVGEGKPRKYYVITDEGRKIRGRLLEIWRNQNNIVGKLLEGMKNV